MILKIIGAVSGRLFDFIFPPLCLLCDQPCSHRSEWFCKKCNDYLVSQLSNVQRCSRCSVSTTRGSCTCNQAWDFPFDSITSFFDFDDITQKIMHHIKYQGKKNLALHLGATVARMRKGDFLDAIDLLVPVPLHPSRLRKRGFNQAKLIAQGFLEGSCKTEINIGDKVLRRKKATKTQTKLSKLERAHNLKGVFEVPPSMIATIMGKRIALVDDVVTTGATVASCAQILLDAGAKSVSVISLIRD